MRNSVRIPNIYKASNVTFDSLTKKAYSYNWWRFVDVIEGVTVFNTYYYSNTTARHQYKVRRLMHNLGIKIDISLSVSGSLSDYDTLSDLYLDAEEQACDKYLRGKIKAQDYYHKVKARRLAERETQLKQVMINESNKQISREEEGL